MKTLSNTPPDTHRKMVGMDKVMLSLNCSRWKLWDLCRNDDEFPNPRMIAGKNQWFEDELEIYKESRPRRQYADSAA